MSDLIERAGWLADKLHNGGDYGKEAAALLISQASAIERLTAELAAARDSARRDGMSAAASMLEAEHERSSGSTNDAGYYARIIREHAGR